MTIELIEAKVKSIIANNLNVNESEISNTSSFTDDLGADSLDTVELMMEFEKAFHLAIPDEEMENITTVQDAINLIHSKQPK